MQIFHFIFQVELIDDLDNMTLCNSFLLWAGNFQLDPSSLEECYSTLQSKFQVLFPESTHLAEEITAHCYIALFVTIAVKAS